MSNKIFSTTTDIIQIKVYCPQLLIIFFFMSSFHGKAQDCNIITTSPIVFHQDLSKKEKAESIINSYRDSIVQNNDISKIGITKTEILDDLDYMINHPNTTLLNDSGYYCGVVAILNWMLNNRPDVYTKAVIDLTFYGATKLNNGSKEIKLPRAICQNVDYSQIKDSTISFRTDIGKISLSDFVFGVSLVNSEKLIQKIGLLWKNSTHSKKNLGNFLFANTMPWEMDDYFKTLGIEKVIYNYYQFFKNKKDLLLLIDTAVKEGKMPIIMENHLITADRHKNLFYKTFGAHFITIHDFYFNSECNTISMSYWDYGSVKNHREQSVKGSSHAAKTLKGAIRKAKKKTKIKEGNYYLEISTEQFLKGLKGYWIAQ